MLGSFRVDHGLQAVSTTLWSGIPLLVAFGSFATAAYTSDKPLTADVIFPCISLFNLLQFPLAMVSSLRFIAPNHVNRSVSVCKYH
jgi:hypothetical protein